jgi:hypothetical protein
VHGRRDQGIELAGERARDCPIEERQYVVRIGWIGSARDACRGERQIHDGQLAGHVGSACRACGACVGAQTHRESQRARTLLEERPIAKAYQLTRQLF